MAGRDRRSGSTRRRPPPRQSGLGDKRIRGGIVVFVAVCVGVFLLVKGDGDTGAAAPRSTTELGGSVTTTSSAPPSTAVAAAQLPILAVNGAGSTDNSLASKTKAALAALGYTNVTPADSKPKDAYPTTQVWFRPGFEGDAKAVASALGLPAVRVAALPQDPKAGNINDAQVVVALGPDAPGVTPAGQ